MTKISDSEFGEISLRRNRHSRSIRLKLDARGALSITLPLRAPLFLARQLLDDSRDNIRQSLRQISQSKTTYQEGDTIGKSHRLRIQRHASRECSHRLSGTELVIYAPYEAPDDVVQLAIHEGVAKALRTQAKAYLPHRIETLAGRHGFSYERLRYSSAGTRWGSCSSQGTISLNIWLMQLPFELIDYVILHELCHTRHMNHGDDFWGLLGEYCPNYKELRRTLRQHNPYA